MIIFAVVRRINAPLDVGKILCIHYRKGHGPRNSHPRRYINFIETHVKPMT